MQTSVQHLAQASKSHHLVLVGQITGAHGIHGWLKIQSYTDPPTNLFTYNPWLLSTAHPLEHVEVRQYQPHSKGFIAQLNGCDDRTSAEQYIHKPIHIEREQLPPLTAGEYYWHDLENLEVITTQGVSIGIVEEIFTTGANDVLIVQGKKRHLIPYLNNEVIKQVDLQKKLIHVDWDPDF